MLLAKQPVEKSSGNDPPRAARPRQPAVAQSKLTLIKRAEQKPGLHDNNSNRCNNLYDAVIMAELL